MSYSNALIYFLISLPMVFYVLRTTTTKRLINCYLPVIMFLMAFIVKTYSSEVFYKVFGHETMIEALQHSFLFYGAWLGVRNKKYMLAIIFSILFLEEINYFQVFFAFETPEALININEQEEFSFHNIKYIHSSTNLVLALISLIIIKCYKKVFGHSIYLYTLPTLITNLSYVLVEYILVPIDVGYLNLAQAFGHYEEIGECLLYLIILVIFKERYQNDIRENYD